MRRIFLLALLLTATTVQADDARVRELAHRLHGLTYSRIPPPTPAGFNPAAARTFNITARSWRFDVSPSPFVVDQGDSVTLHISVPANDSSDHGFFLVDHMTQGVEIVRGRTVTVNFIANTAGSFFFFCTIFCGDGHGTMFSSMIVNSTAPPAAPTITSFTPQSGPPSGGTVVAITGTNFQSGATVRFGGTPAVSTVVNSATSITAVNPARPAGAVAVSVTNADGQSGSASSMFTYGFPAPAISEFTPASGPSAGGTVVAITGTNFQSGATVRFGDTTAASTVVNSATSITAVSPARSAGTVQISVTNPDGQSASASSMFTFEVPGPAISTFTPANGPPAGGTTVTILGTNFQAGATVRFGDSLAVSTVVNSPSSITAVSPARAAGGVTISVTNPDGRSASSPSSFTYLAATSGIKRRAVRR